MLIEKYIIRKTNTSALHVKLYIISHFGIIEPTIMVEPTNIGRAIAIIITIIVNSILRNFGFFILSKPPSSS